MRYCLMLLYTCYPIQVVKHDSSKSVVKNEIRNLEIWECFVFSLMKMIYYYILNPTKSSLNKSKTSVVAFSFAE